MKLRQVEDQDAGPVDWRDLANGARIEACGKAYIAVYPSANSSAIDMMTGLPTTITTPVFHRIEITGEENGKLTWERIPAEIVKRLGLYPDLVEACERTEREIRLTREALAIGRTGANAIGLGMAYDAVVAILARCKEVPK